MTQAVAPPTDAESLAATPLDPRTQILLSDPVLPLILRLAWPNLLVMLLQASTGLIETYWVGRLGPDALAGMALVFPAFMLMQMLSVGAMGGGVSSAVARALGAGRRGDADRIAFHGVLLFGLIGAVFSVLAIVFGRPFYTALGAKGGALEAALAYSNVIFAGNILLWVMNAFASALRGTGDMLVPAGVTGLGVVLIVPLSPLLIYGYGPLPGFGVAGGGLAIVIFNAVGCAYLAWHLLSGRSLLSMRAGDLEWRFFADILKIGALASLTTVQTNLIFVVVTAVVGHLAGDGALAGYGTAARLEYLLIPLAFGFGAPLVPLVGTNIGAGLLDRARRIAFTGGATTFVAATAVGLAGTAFSRQWLGLFGSEPIMLATGASYLTIAGPTFGFFGLGMALYFASQGAGHLLLPLAVTAMRTVIAVGGAVLVGWWDGPLSVVFAAVAVGLLAYGLVMTFVTARTDWRVAGHALPMRGDVR